MPDDKLDKETDFAKGSSQPNQGLIDELKKANAELLEARRAALDLMEDAILSKEALMQSEEKYRTMLEQEVRDRTAELNASRNLLKATMDASMDMIQVFEAVRNEHGEIVDFRYVLLNHEAERLMPGATGKSLLQLQPGVVKEGIFQEFKQVVETGIPSQNEHHYVHEQFNGWFFQSIVKLGDGVATTTTDISSRKQAELEVRQSKTLLQNLIDAPDIGMAVYKALRNDKGEIIDFIHEYINRASLSMLGGEDFTGRHFTDHGQNALEQMPHLIEVIENGKGNAYTREEDFSGKKVWFAITNTPLDSERLVHTWEDVTEQKKAEQEIIRLKDEIAQKATNKYYSLFNSIDEGFCIIEMIYDDEDKAIDFRYIEVNKVYIRETGQQDPTGKLGSEVTPNNEPTWLEIYDKIARTGEPLRFENYHDGSGKWYYTYASRVGGEESRHVAIVFSDVTERKQREGHQQFLIKISDALRAEPDADVIANRAIKMLAGHLRLDRCYVGIALLADDLGIFPYQFGNERVQAMPEKGVRLSDFPDALRKTFDETLVITDFQNTEGLTETEKQNFATLGFGALVVANVRKEERNPYWSINAVSATPRRWTPSEIQLIEEVTERTWAAVERAKAEEALRESEERKEFLLQLNDTLRELSDPVAIEYEAARLVAEKLNADRVHFAELSEDEKLVIRKDYVRGKAPSIAGVTKAKMIATALKLERDEPVVIPDVETFPLLTEEEKATLAAAKIRSQLSVALSKKGKKVASFSVDQTAPREWKPLEISILQEAAERTLAAVERAKAEEAVRKSQERLQKSLSIETVGVVYFDLEGGIHDANTAFERMSGYSKKDFVSVGVRWTELTPPEFMEVTLKSKEELFTTGQNTPYEKQYIKPDGSRWWGLFAGKHLAEKEYVEFVVDITESKKAEEALRESEEKFSSLFESSPAPSLILKPDAPHFTITEVNQAYMRATMRTREDLVGNGLFMAFPDNPADVTIAGVSTLRASLERVLATHKTDALLDLKYDIARPDGTFEEHWWSPVNSPVLNEYGEVESIIHNVIDVTERHRAEEALRESEERFRTLADAVPQVIWTNNADGTANYFNQRWYEYSGLSFEQSEGPGWEVIVHPEDALASKEKWHKALASGSVFDTEYRLRGSDGSYRWFIGRNVPIKDRTGKTIGWFGSATDIEELKKVQEALIQSEEKLRITMESATDYAIINMDAEGRIERWSSGASQIFGYSEEEVIGQLGELIFTDEDRLAGVPQQEMEIAREKGRATDERWHQRKDGSRFFMSGFMRPIYNDQLTGYVKVARDMTQQQLFTEELHRLVAERTKELQHSNESLQQFATIAAHDLQEPLRKLRFFSTLLQRQKEKLPQEGQELLTRIDATSVRMSQLISEVLQYSRIAYGAEEKIPVNLDQILLNVLSDLELKLEETGATIIYDNPLPAIEAVPLQMNQLFYNMLTNSLKYKQKEVRPVLKILVTSLPENEVKKYPELNSNKSYIEIRFIDNGIGFDEKFSEQIFQIFERLHSKEEYEGTGVGLALCKKIVENHKGYIYATSGNGEGATFHIILPITKDGLQ